MDDNRRKELEALRDHLFFEFVQDSAKQVEAIYTLIQALHENTDKDLSLQSIIDSCDEVERAMIYLYFILEKDTVRINHIIDLLNDEEDSD